MKHKKGQILFIVFGLLMAVSLWLPREAKAVNVWVIGLTAQLVKKVLMMSVLDETISALLRLIWLIFYWGFWE